MATYLLTWNPNRWNWEDQESLQECIAEIEEQGYCEDRWSCGRTKKIRPKDRLFILRLGIEPRGIFASGQATSGVYEDDHWESGNPNKALFVDISLDTLLNPTGEEGILSLGELERISTNQTWTPQSSGISIEDVVASELEIEWSRFLNVERGAHPPEEIMNVATLREGAARQILVNAYERNPEARKLCIEYYGTSCSACDFNFEDKYGEMGKDFIHVHHLKPLADVREEYIVDPVNDLRPVCANCHAMIHKKKPAYTVEEIQELLSEQLNR